MDNFDIMYFIYNNMSILLLGILSVCYWEYFKCVKKLQMLELQLKNEREKQKQDMQIMLQKFVVQNKAVEKEREYQNKAVEKEREYQNKAVEKEREYQKFIAELKRQNLRTQNLLIELLQANKELNRQNRNMALKAREEKNDEFSEIFKIGTAGLIGFLLFGHFR